MKTISTHSIPFRRLFLAIALTIALAGTIHIFIGAIDAVSKHSVRFINPVYFLGLNNLLPRYQDSGWATVVAWGLLTVVLGGIFYLLGKKHE
jgi:predicted membrane channel-forming protein YqfA (hemolysin III family)